MIWAIGNSHCNVFTDSHPGNGNIIKNDMFVSVPLGPVIAYNFKTSHYPKVIDILNRVEIDKQCDKIMLVVGEVDCRWHIPKQAQVQNREQLDVVEECVDRLFDVYKDLNDNGYNIIVWGGHPSTNRGHSEDDFPIFGEVINRNKIAKNWHNFLHDKATENNFPFISLVDELINDDGTTDMHYFVDDCHLEYDKIKHWITEKFKVL